jgi:hypothetical protein
MLEKMLIFKMLIFIAGYLLFGETPVLGVSKSSYFLKSSRGKMEYKNFVFGER